MYKIIAYRVGENPANINPLSVKRKWMDDTWNSHAYHCFPVSLTNQLGWGISFPEDISFIWDGISDSSSEHVKVLEGHKYVYTGRANGTISFHTGIRFLTDKNISMFQGPVPNSFIDGVQAFSSIISTSFFDGELPCAMMINKPNVKITISAGTPIVSLMPIDLSKIQDSKIEFDDLKNAPPLNIDVKEYSKEISLINKMGKWSNFYRNATDHLGNKIGEHQVKSIKLHVKD